MFEVSRPSILLPSIDPCLSSWSTVRTSTSMTCATSQPGEASKLAIASGLEARTGSRGPDGFRSSHCAFPHHTPGDGATWRTPGCTHSETCCTSQQPDLKQRLHERDPVVV